MRFVRDKDRFLPLLVLAIGVMGVSSGSIFARMADAPALVKSAYRLGLSSLILVPIALLFHREEYRKLAARDLRTALLSGLFLALHFATWISSLDYTTIASSVMLVNTVPIWVALIQMALGRGRPSRTMWFCIGMSVVGAGIVGYGDLAFDRRALLGDALAVAGAVAAACYILCGKEVRRKIDMTSYVALCYGSAAVLMWAAVICMGYEVANYSRATWGAFWGMALLSQVVGHSSYNWALGSFSAGFVSIMLLGEPIGSAILAYFLFDEMPTPIKFAGFAFILLSIVVSARYGGDSDAA